MDALPPTLAFPEIGIRRNAELIDIFAAGDEKLFHFTGKSGDVRLVKSKPDQIGLWFYEIIMLATLSPAFPTPSQ